MKKIIKAETAWRNAMNALINDYYDCDTCCEDLGAIGENECYQLYNGMHEYVFTKVGDVFKQFEFTDASAEYLLLTNWTKLNPTEDWYDKERTFRFLLEDAQGHNVHTDIDITTLIWMGIYTEGDMVHVTEYKDKEVEVTTDEIIATQREFIERCKGKTLEEIRDTFDGYNWGEYGEGTFDLIFKGFVFSIYKDEKGDGYYLSKVVLDEECRNEGEGKTFTLPYLPKEIKVDMTQVTFSPTFGYSNIIDTMRTTCIQCITDWYNNQDKKYVEIDTHKWLQAHGDFAEYYDGWGVALTKKNDKVVLIGTDSDDYEGYDATDNWDYVSLEEMLYIINQLASK